MGKRGPKSKAEMEAITNALLGAEMVADIPKISTEPAKDESEFVLIKTTNRFVITKLIEKGVNVKHISGSGQPNSPKVWFIEAAEKALNELSEDEQKFIENAVVDEIQECINQSIIRKNEEKHTSAAQKRLPGAPIMPSKIY